MRFVLDTLAEKPQAVPRVCEPQDERPEPPKEWHQVMLAGVGLSGLLDYGSASLYISIRQKALVV